MECKHPQKSEIKQKFRIPIEKYEECMNAKPSIEKKKEILDLLENHSKLCSEEEYKEIEQELYRACNDGDTELIKIFLNETIENASKTLKFKIDEVAHTASLFKVDQNIEQFIVPRTVRHKSTQYLITSICGTGTNIKSINFVEESEVKTIYKDAFRETNLEEIYFPKSLKELKEGWCNSVEKLTKIRISPLNDQYLFKDFKYLLGKHSQKNDKFDILLFGRRDIEKISIPSNIKTISSHAFEYCKNLTNIEIPINSDLQTIKEFAFTYSGINEISIPSKVSEICGYAFCLCSNLTKINIPTMNRQFIFKDDKYLLGKSDPNNDEYDIFLFARRDIKKVSIPSNIKIISSYSFFHCQNLINIEIPSNSNLQTIGKDAFCYTNIKNIFIPSKVSKICEGAFSCCHNLKKVEIPTNSNLQTIEFDSFLGSNIKSIFIPSNLTNINEYAFSDCYNFQIIEISEEFKSESLPFSSLYGYSNLIIMVPSCLIHSNEAF